MYSWSIVETNVGVLSACLPTLRPLVEGRRFSSVFSRLSSSSRSESKSTTGYPDNIRLNTVESGLSEDSGSDARVRERYNFAVYEYSNVPVQKQKAAYIRDF